MTVAFDAAPAQLLTMTSAQHDDTRRYGDQKDRADDHISDEFASDVDHGRPVT